MNKETLTVVKIGGNIVDSPSELNRILDEFVKLNGKKILVHGGGKIATKISRALGIETKMVEGRRITDKETIEIVTMVYAGGINKSIVAQLQAKGHSAWGVCGADGGIIPSLRRPVKDIDYGYVGDVKTSEIKSEVFSTLLSAGFSIVVAPITMSAEGELLNTNADTIAQSIAVAPSSLYAVQLVYIFEKPGVLEDVSDVNSVIENITSESYVSLKEEGKIFEGMIPKIDNALKAVSSGVGEVRISNSCLLGTGTTIK